jgi:F-box and leucine-rich repeat protein GRR1
MPRSPRRNRSQDSRSNSSSASTSPERGIDDDGDSFMQHPNDSQSSLAPSFQHDDPELAAREIEERCRLSPIYRLPAELMVAVFAKLSSPADLRNCMLVSKDWARNSVHLLWHRPQTNKWPNLQIVARTVFSSTRFFDYASLIRRLNMSALTFEVSDGTLEPLSSCKRIERLTLTNCSQLTDASIVKMIDNNRSLLALDVTGISGVTDRTMMAVANNCFRLQGLNITNCRNVTDESLEAVARNCKYLKRVGVLLRLWPTLKTNSSDSSNSMAVLKLLTSLSWFLL